jgi:superfamily II DNA or RNA helicase
MPPKKKVVITQPLIPVGSTYLSKRGYAFDKTEENEALCIALRKELTVKPIVNMFMPGADLINEFLVYRESVSKFYVPRVFGLEKFGVPTHVTLTNGTAASGLVFDGILRPRQEAPVAAFLVAAVDPLRRGGILELACAEGKTVMSLYIACQLGVRTLVIAHKEFLCNQWHERIRQFIPTAKVGIIKQSKVVVDNMDIVLASLQSLAMRDYNDDIFKGFGFVILDECHHTGAEVFSRALAKVNSRVMLGLSATVTRKDGLTKVFEWHIGKPVYTIRKRDDPDVTIVINNYYDSDPEYCEERLMWNGKVNFAATISAIVNFAPRNAIIIEMMCAIKQRDPERRILVLSERRGHLNALRDLIMAVPDNILGTIGYYVGGMKEAALKASESADVLLATYAMASEGMDVPGLDTLVLASPVTAIEQPVGRILRQKPEDRKHVPVVIDIIDGFGMFIGQGKRRLAFYKKQGYKIDKSIEDPPLEKPMEKYCFINRPCDS